ncbi:MAG: hypothetical protein MUE65_02635 [Methanomassiliicoccales archaeon]|jgi:hypothetical protein|nr:hypothetical protein [Methanomassiliicoccales archaeon]
MASKVTVEAAICSHSTEIVARDIGEGRVALEIVSDCPNVAMYAEMLTEADMHDLTEWEGNRVLDLAGKAGLTTTCLVPAAIFNCAFVELGMMSKGLAMEKGPLCIHFVE